MLEQWQSTCDLLDKDDTGPHDLSLAHSVPGGMNHSHMPASSTNLVSNTGSYDHLNGGGSFRNHYSAGAFDTLSDKDSVSLHAHSITASHVEKTLSEVASSLSSPFPRPGPNDPSYTQMRIWLLTAELQLRLGNLAEAEHCVMEAKNLSPLNYHLMHMRGMIHEHKEEFEVARQWFENSLAINPTHVASLLHLGTVNHQLGFARLAEQSLKLAVRIDPNNEELWAVLGDVMASLAAETLRKVEEDNTRCLEENERTPTEATSTSIIDEAKRMYRRSAECHSVALALQRTCPVLPFTTIPLCFE